MEINFKYEKLFKTSCRDHANRYSVRNVDVVNEASNSRASLSVHAVVYLCKNSNKNSIPFLVNKTLLMSMSINVHYCFIVSLDSILTAEDNMSRPCK